MLQDTGPACVVRSGSGSRICSLTRRATPHSLAYVLEHGHLELAMGLLLI